MAGEAAEHGTLGVRNVFVDADRSKAEEQQQDAAR
jgi:hypothetical protein